MCAWPIAIGSRRRILPWCRRIILNAPFGAKPPTKKSCFGQIGAQHTLWPGSFLDRRASDFRGDSVVWAAVSRLCLPFYDADIAALLGDGCTHRVKIGIPKWRESAASPEFVDAFLGEFLAVRRCVLSELDARKKWDLWDAGVDESEHAGRRDDLLLSVAPDRAAQLSSFGPNTCITARSVLGLMHP
jgi:hypothetical protein